MRKMLKSTKALPFIFIALIMAFIPLATIGCSDDEGTTIIMQTPYAESDVTALMAKKFKELVEEKTNDDVKVELYYNGVLAEHKDQFEALQTGTLDAAVENQGYCRSVDPNFDFSGQLQGLLITQAHGEAVYTNATYRTYISDLFEDYGIHFLDYIPSYLIFGYFANFDIDSVYDVKDQAIYLGRPGTPDPANQMLGVKEQFYVAWADFPAAVQGGQIDVQLTPTAIAPYTGTTDVFSNVVLRPFYNTNMVLIAQDVWDDISEENQDIITNDVMPEVIEYTEGLVIQQHVQTLGLIVDKLGLDKIKVQSVAEEEQMWTDLQVYPAFTALAATMNQDIYDLILELRPTYDDYDPIVKDILDQAGVPY